MFDSFVALSEYLHEMRAKRTRRSPGFAMRYGEVWTSAVECPRNGISGIRLFDNHINIPKPFSGLFVRLQNGETNYGAVYVDKDLEDDLKEFAIIKELMHCWSPGHTYVGTPDAVRDLVEALVAEATPYTADVTADKNAVLAAAEVILPHYTVERKMAQNKDFSQIAFECNLSERLVKSICRHDILHARKTGKL